MAARSIMKQTHWSLIIAGSDARSGVRTIRIPVLVVLLGVVIMIAGLGGAVRLTRFAVSYGYARFGVYQRRNENEALLNKIRFLDKFTAQQRERVTELVSFEDITRLKYGLNSISEDVRMAGVGGRPRQEELLLASLLEPSVGRADSIRENINELQRQVRLQNNTFSRMAEHVRRQHLLWDQRPSLWPVRGRITSPFGRRVHPFTGVTTFHEGLDIANKAWTPVYAPADGVVSYVGYRPYYGNLAIIEHAGSGIETRYAHLMRAAVDEGQPVRRGEMIGYLGNTGRSTGPHLHYEVRKNNQPVNPMDYILPVDVAVD